MSKLKDIQLKLLYWKHRVYTLASNLWYWIPRIYDCNPWDYLYLERLVTDQLARMTNNFELFNAKYGSERELREIKIAHKLLYRVQTGYYHNELDKYYGADYNIDAHGHFTATTNFDNLGEYFDKYPRAYKEAVKWHSKKSSSEHGSDKSRFMIGNYMSEIMHSKARRLAYKIIAEYSPRWWV